MTTTYDSYKLSTIIALEVRHFPVINVILKELSCNFILHVILKIQNEFMYLFFRSFLLPNKLAAKRLELTYNVVTQGTAVEFRKFDLIFNMSYFTYFETSSNLL